MLSASSSIGNSRYALTNYPSALLEYQLDRRLGCPPVFRYGHRRIANAAAGCESHENFSVHTASTTDFGGHAGDFLLSHSRGSSRRRSLSGCRRIAFRFPRGTRVARGINLVRDRVGGTCSSYASSKSNQRCAPRGTPHSLAFIFRSRGCRCAMGLLRLSRASLEHLAPVVPDIAGRLFDCDPDRRGGNLPTPDLDSIDLRLDVQQYQRQSPHCDDCAPGAQPGCESNTHTCGRRRATSHHRTSLSCCSHDRRLYNKHSNASRSQRPCIMSNSSAIG